MREFFINFLSSFAGTALGMVLVAWLLGLIGRDRDDVLDALGEDVEVDKNAMRRGLENGRPRGPAPQNPLEGSMWDEN